MNRKRKSSQSFTVDIQIQPKINRKRTNNYKIKNERTCTNSTEKNWKIQIFHFQRKKRRKRDKKKADITI